MLYLLISLIFTLYDADSDVILLTKETYESELMQSDDIWIVEFYAPWCGHCKNMAPEYNAAAKHCKGKIKMAAVDATENQDLASLFKVQGYPTMKLFMQDKSQPPSPFDLRKQNEITDFCDNIIENLQSQWFKQQNIIENITSLEEFYKVKQYKILFVYSDYCQKSKNVFENVIQKLSEKYQNKAIFYGLNYQTQQDIAEQLKAETFPSVIYFNPDSEEGISYKGEFGSMNELGLFIKKEVTRHKYGDDVANMDGDVIQLYDNDFEKKVFESDDAWFIKIFQPWCGHCKTMYKDWKKTAEQLKGHVKVAEYSPQDKAVKDLEYNGFPTIIYFPKGKKDVFSAYNYQGARLTDDLVKQAMEWKDTLKPKQLNEINSSFKNKCGQNLCIIIFYENFDSNEDRKTLFKLQNKYMDQPVTFFYTHKDQQKQMEDQFNVMIGYPYVVAIRQRNKAFQIMQDEYSMDNIEKFIEKISLKQIKFQQYENELEVIGSAEDLDNQQQDL